MTFTEIVFAARRCG